MTAASCDVTQVGGPAWVVVVVAPVVVVVDELVVVDEVVVVDSESPPPSHAAAMAITAASASTNIGRRRIADPLMPGTRSAHNLDGIGADRADDCGDDLVERAVGVDVDDVVVELQRLELRREDRRPREVVRPGDKSLGQHGFGHEERNELHGEPVRQASACRDRECRAREHDARRDVLTEHRVQAFEPRDALLLGQGLPACDLCLRFGCVRVVAVDERHTEALGNERSDRRFPRASNTHEDDRWRHRPGRYVGCPVRAVTVLPGTPDSARLDDVPDPDPSLGSVLVEAVATGVCGTDREIASGAYGWAPPGHERLVLGHESLGRVLDPGPTSGLREGDLVVGVVRRPDPVPCSSCAVGEWDMCRNGMYTERGIKSVDGYMSERWRIEPEYAVRVAPDLGLLGVLLEPTTVVAKAWEVVAAIGDRAFWEPSSVLVTGAGPIGLLAALLGVQRGFDVHVLDRAESGPKPELVRALGATYHTCGVLDLPLEPDIVIEATGVRQVVLESMRQVASGGVVCLTGLGGGAGTLEALPGDPLADEIVLQNKVVVGSVNANRRHYYKGARALARADRGWLEGLVTRREPIERFADALAPQPDGIKTVIELSS